MTKIVYSICILTCLSLAACQKKKAPVDPEIPVNLMKVTSQQVLYYDKFPGTTQAMSQVSLLPQLQGAITQIFFTEGARVRKGQKLYEIDQRLYQASYDAAVANLRVSQGNLLQAKQDADRYAYLNGFNAVAKQLYDHAMIAMQNAESQVKSADQALKTAKTNLTYSIIYAPFDGTIGFSQVKLGNIVVPGQTVLNTISTNNPMAVDFLINEKQLDHFEKLEKGKLHASDSLFTLILPNNSMYTKTGKMSVIDRAVDPQTGSIRIRLVFPNPENSLKAGMSCVVRVHNQETEPQVLIPSKAVVEQMGEYFVFVAKDTLIKNDTAKVKTPQNQGQKPMLLAKEKKIKLGQNINGNVIVKSGLNAGESLVLDGVQSLHDGAQITTANKVAPGSGGKPR